MNSNYNRFLAHSGLIDHPYQRKGVEWCLSREQSSSSSIISGTEAKTSSKNGTEHTSSSSSSKSGTEAKTSPKTSPGGILADEMGLGKTITMLALIALNIKSHQQTLIVVPPVLIEQWESQSAKILGHTPLVFYGASKKDTPTIPDTALIVITSYETMGHPVLREKHWDRIIYDEAHHMRNAKTRTFHRGRRLTATVKWMLTGTPIQNKLKDLFSLFMLLKLPTALYHDDETRGQLIKKYMLRRTNALVGLDKKMPPITVHPKMTSWEDAGEKQISEEIHAQLAYSNVDRTRASDEQYGGTLPIVLYTRSKQMCVLGLNASIAKQALTTAPATKAAHQNQPAPAAPRRKSSKISHVLKTLLENRHNGAKKIVFCHFRAEMDIIQELLDENGIRTNMIDGRITSKAKRMEIIKDPDTEVLILQIQVGCEGLNLQTYSEVYFVSPTWNPFVEFQAIGRCYRMGQKKPVNVYRFYMNGFDSEHKTKTQDSYMASVQNNKKQIDRDTFM